MALAGTNRSRVDSGGVRRVRCPVEVPTNDWSSAVNINTCLKFAVSIVPRPYYQIFGTIVVLINEDESPY